MISLTTLRICRQVLGTTTWTLTTEQLADTARDVTAAMAELDQAIEEHGRLAVN